MRTPGALTAAVFLWASVALAQSALQVPPACQAADPNPVPAAPPVPNALYEVNVLTDCPGVVGDGTTDDWFALQSCVYNNPGKHIALPKTQFYPASVDYFSSQTLMLCGSSQWISGETPGRDSDATQIRFPPSPAYTNNFTGTMTGPGMLIPGNCYSCKVSDLILLGGIPGDGGNCMDFRNPLSYDPPLYTYNWCANPATTGRCSHGGTAGLAYTGFGPDGLVVTADAVSVDRVAVKCFERHGFAILGDESVQYCPPGEACGGEADDWSMRDDLAVYNRGFGLLLTGADENAGNSVGFETNGNQLGAVGDNSVEGNSYSASQSTGDGFDQLTETYSTDVTHIGIMPGMGLTKCTLTAPLPGGIFVPGSWITVKNLPDPYSPDNGTFRVLQSTANTLTYYCPTTSIGAPAFPNALVTASSADIYTAGIPNYGVPSNQLPAPTTPNAFETDLVVGAFAAWGATYINWGNPYCDITSWPPSFGPGNMVFGGLCPPGLIPNPPIQQWQELSYGRLLGGGGLVFDARSPLGEVLSLVGGSPATSSTMSDQTRHEELQFRGPDNYDNIAAPEGLGYNSGILWYDLFHGCSPATASIPPACSATAPTHYLSLLQGAAALGEISHNAVIISEAGDVTISPPVDDVTPKVSTLTLGSAGATGGTVVQANLTANQNVFVPGLLPPQNVVAVGINPAGPSLYSYYVWANYANGAGSVYSQPGTTLSTEGGQSSCPVNVQVVWTPVTGASSYTVYRQFAGGAPSSAPSGVVATVLPPARSFKDNNPGAACGGDGSPLPPYAPNEGVLQAGSWWTSNMDSGMGGPDNTGWTTAAVNSLFTGCGPTANDMYFAPGERTGECPRETAPLILGSNNTATINNLVVTQSCTFPSNPESGCGGGSGGTITVTATYNGDSNGSVSNVSSVNFEPAQVQPGGLQNSALVTILPEGDSGDVQFNDDGVFGGNGNLLYQERAGTWTLQLMGDEYVDGGLYVSEVANVTTLYADNFVLFDPNEPPGTEIDNHFIVASQQVPIDVSDVIPVLGSQCDPGTGSNTYFIMDTTYAVGGPVFCSCSGTYMPPPPQTNNCFWTRLPVKATSASAPYSNTLTGVSQTAIATISNVTGVALGTSCATPTLASGSTSGDGILLMTAQGTGAGTVSVYATVVNSSVTFRSAVYSVTCMP